MAACTATMLILIRSAAALHGRVDGGALGAGAARAVGAVDLGQDQAPAEHRLDVALGLGRLARLVHVAPHARVALEVAGDVAPGRRVVDAEVLRASPKLLWRRRSAKLMTLA